MSTLKINKTQKFTVLDTPKGLEVFDISENQK